MGHYNTRRISLSLPSLGVQLPRAHRPANSSPLSDKSGLPSAKRLKRSHTLSSTPLSQAFTPPPSSPVRHATSIIQRTLQSAVPGTNDTPPPSPPSAHHPKLDYEGINDDIVVGVLQQLEKTGNRPHLIKELATILGTSLKCVESSANPAAIISSRLTNYLKRPWTALAPCPLAKEQTMAHPRRVYFFLTTVPRQLIPEFSTTPTTFKRLASPSISSGFEEEEVEERKRDVLSPSPEVDLSVPVHEDSHAHAIADLTFPMDDFTIGEPEPEPVTHVVSSSNRAPSPPLEQDEREFTQTASVMQQRKQCEQAEQQSQMEMLGLRLTASPPGFAPPSLSMSVDSLGSLDSMESFEEIVEDESEEKMSLRNQEAAAMLFGAGHVMSMMDYITSSPMLKPVLPLRIDTTPRKELSAMDIIPRDADSIWAELKSPETIELSELDAMLGAF